MQITNKPSILLGNITGNTDSSTLQIVNRGFSYLNTIISNPLFEKEFMLFPFEQTQGKKNQDLWDLFLKSSPISIDVDIRDMGWMANHIHRTIGAENAKYPGTVFMNSYFVKTGFMVGDNAIHEVWHKLGFSHNKASDTKSVPYGCNLLYEKVATVLNIDPNT